MTTDSYQSVPYEEPRTFEDARQLKEAAEETPEQRKARLEAHNDEARKRINLFHRTVTQGEWIAIARGLDMPRPDIEGDTNLLLLALAYVKEKRDLGAASWDLLLNLTDEQLLERHGFDTSTLGEED